MTKTLIIGRGSAGQRHARVLKGMGHDITICSSKNIPSCVGFDYIVVASLTPDHASNLQTIADMGYTGKVLVEKPLYMDASEAKDYSFQIYVGYQLRFHPVIRALKEALEGATVYSAHIYAGQHIDLWGGAYHGDKTKGGGVLRDYSHELDLIQWLFGTVNCSQGGHAVREEASGYESCAALVLVALGGASIISLQLNYHDKTPRREWIVNTDMGSFGIDLVKNVFCSPLGNTLFMDSFNDRLVSGSLSITRRMHEAILDNGNDVCTFAEGLAINKLIDRIEL